MRNIGFLISKMRINSVGLSEACNASIVEAERPGGRWATTGALRNAAVAKSSKSVRCCSLRSLMAALPFRSSQRLLSAHKPEAVPAGLFSLDLKARPHDSPLLRSARQFRDK